MKKSANLKLLAEAGIKFSGIDCLVEIFPAPIPESIDGIDIDSESDLFQMSSLEGYDVLFIPSAENLQGESDGKEYQFKRTDFLKWQLMRFSEKTIFQLINKTDCDVTQLLDDDSEFEKDPDDSPHTWLNPFEDDPSIYEKGLKYIARLREEVPEVFYSKLIKSILDPKFGVQEHLETEISNNLNEVRQMYAHWTVPLMIVSVGRFFPYTEADYDIHIRMDDYRLEHMYVRNYDEGDVEG
jgi:hypothetical protein